ncbi:hypothetical protein NP493_1462g00019 [Ridgeia piscesae]|uniref:Uncharacterized protein n=1 Tax=Ridgeia piscesae TaxID=27915 RepID=A0AAD9K1Z3_RIDPI|nr:hypothetical protein NP493_1462g00019 [Ridgeia piscesae]
MGDAASRKNAAVIRLRQQLKKKKEALADQFEYKMYMVFHFKDQKKACAVFEITEVLPVMTNNYEESILRGVKDDSYSYESSRELLERDVVQLHAPRWQSMRKDVIGCTTDMNFFLWPRKDIERMECLLFSRWKGEENSIFKPLEAKFDFHHEDYEKQLMRLLVCKDKSGLIISNPAETMFLFVDRQHLETSKSKAIVFKLSSICLYLPQDRLTYWGPGTCKEVVDSYLNSPLTDN